MFFDPKARVTPRPIGIWRGKSGHRRAGCCSSRKARAGVAVQAAATESVTENKPPGGSSEPPGKGEKVGQEPTAPRREAGGMKNPFRCKTK